MITGKTEKGFEFEVSENVGTDFRIVEATAKFKSGQPLQRITGMYDLISTVLGEKGIERMKAFAVEQCGYADTNFIMDQVDEIIGIANEKAPEIKKS